MPHPFESEVTLPVRPQDYIQIAVDVLVKFQLEGKRFFQS